MKEASAGWRVGRRVYQCCGWMMEGTATFWMARGRGAVVEVSVLVVGMRRDVLDVSSDVQKSLN